MQHLGRYRQGDELPVVVQVTDAGGSPAFPSAHPTLTIHRPAGGVAKSRVVPADRRDGAVGRFGIGQFLGVPFLDPGRYVAITSWPAPAGGIAVAVSQFTLMAGGHSDGPPVSMTAVRTPDTNRLLWQTAGGNLVTGLNPRVP